MTELLIRKAKKGDKDAFCRLIKYSDAEHVQGFRTYSKNDEDAADAIAETDLSCFRK